MKVLGIIGEYNPIHNGHIYHINTAKNITKSDYTICIMSGTFTQQGNIALQDKFIRAKNLVENGIDLVIELPTPFAVADSGNFANKAVQILNDLNIVDFLCFGAEVDNIAKLTNISKTLINNDQKIWTNIKKDLKYGNSFATSRSNALNEFLNKEEINIIKKPNNILGIEYIKSLLTINSNIKPFIVKRLNSNFNSNILEDTYTSSTSIRNFLLSNKDISELTKYIPNNTYNSLLNSKLLFNTQLFEILKYKIISMTAQEIEKINGVTEGLENKIKKEIINSLNYDEFIYNLKSKRYELSKIKRILINIILNITKDDFIAYRENSCNYAHILAFNHNKKDILSNLSKKSSIPILTSLKNSKLSSLSQAQIKLLKYDIYASNIHSILTNSKLNKDYTNLL